VFYIFEHKNIVLGLPAVFFLTGKKWVLCLSSCTRLLYSDALLHSPGLVWRTSYTKPMGWSLQQGRTGTQYPGKGLVARLFLNAWVSLVGAGFTPVYILKELLRFFS
jgi:hypothetical protein